MQNDDLSVHQHSSRHVDRWADFGRRIRGRGASIIPRPVWSSRGGCALTQRIQRVRKNTLIAGGARDALGALVRHVGTRSRRMIDAIASTRGPCAASHRCEFGRAPHRSVDDEGEMSRVTAGTRGRVYEPGLVARVGLPSAPGIFSPRSPRRRLQSPFGALSALPAPARCSSSRNWPITFLGPIWIVAARPWVEPTGAPAVPPARLRGRAAATRNRKRSSLGVKGIDHARRGGRSGGRCRVFCSARRTPVRAVTWSAAPSQP